MVDIALRQVSKSFGSVAVIKDVDLDIADGEFTVFVRPSGCGKSTLLRLIAGLEDLSAGDLRIGGALMNDVGPADRGIGMVFQSYALYPHMTVAQNMSFGLRMAGRPKAEVAERVVRAADILQLEPLLARKPSQLSGGQRQRVAIGRAIVRDPKVFLFDEPLSNLDAELRVAMRVEIAKLHQRLGNTMIYVTHDQTEAMTLADKIVVLRDGKVAQVGSPLELYENPDSQFVAGFIGSPKMNFIGAATDAGSAIIIDDVRVGLSHIRDWPAPGSAIVAGIRPEHFVAGAAAPVQLPVKVEIVEKLGGTSFVYARSAKGTPLVLEIRAGALPQPGEIYPAGFDPINIRLFHAAGQRLR